jgi:hypothetical protein
VFALDRDDPTGRRVLMLANVHNLAGDVPPLAYRIKGRGDGPAVEWEADPVDVTVEQAPAAAADDPHERDDRSAWDDRLREVLAGGPVLAAEVIQAGRDAGFNLSALQRSQRRIGARSDPQGSGTGS